MNGSLTFLFVHTCTRARKQSDSTGTVRYYSTAARLPSTPPYRTQFLPPPSLPHTAHDPQLMTHLGERHPPRTKWGTSSARRRSCAHRASGVHTNPTTSVHTHLNSIKAAEPRRAGAACSPTCLYLLYSICCTIRSHLASLAHMEVRSRLQEGRSSQLVPRAQLDGGIKRR